MKKENLSRALDILDVIDKLLFVYERHDSVLKSLGENCAFKATITSLFIIVVLITPFFLLYKYFKNSK